MSYIELREGKYVAIPSVWDRLVFRLTGGWTDRHVEDRLAAGELNIFGGNFTDDFGQVVMGVHAPALCEGRHCVIHNPSDHPLRGMKLAWRQAGPFDIKPSHFERICEHGVGHPDPDTVAYHNSIGELGMDVHGRDGCCGS